MGISNIFLNYRTIKLDCNNKDKEHDLENVFLPINFNLVLDYFSNKGKDRSKFNKIQKALNQMDKFIKKDCEDISLSQNESMIIYEEENVKDDENNEEDDNDEDIEEKQENGGIIISKLMNMFGELMRPKGVSAKITKKIIRSKTIMYLLFITIGKRAKSTKKIWVLFQILI